MLQTKCFNTVWQGLRWSVSVFCFNNRTQESQRTNIVNSTKTLISVNCAAPSVAVVNGGPGPCGMLILTLIDQLTTDYPYQTDMGVDFHAIYSGHDVSIFLSWTTFWLFFIVNTTMLSRTIVEADGEWSFEPWSIFRFNLKCRSSICGH